MDSFTLLLSAFEGNCQLQANVKSNTASGKTTIGNLRCYDHNEMRAQSIGRALGIGLRLAGRMAGQRMAGGAQNAGAQAAAQKVDGAGTRDRTDARAAAEAAGQVGRGVARGVGGFLKPFRRVGGIVWLEVTGAFFLLPVAVFAPTLWRVRANWAHGPDHWLFLVTAGVMAVFLYLSISSFWRARKK